MSKKKVNVNPLTGAKGGYIMMLALIIMLTLTVIAVGYVSNVMLETSITRNYRVNRDVLNAAEAGLGVAMRITHEEILGQLEPFSGTARSEYEGDNETKYGYPFQTLFDDYNDVKVKYRVIPENPDPQKNRFLYRTYVSCSEMIHYAYPYAIEVVAEPTSGIGGTQYLKRQIRVLETPLVQYFVFFDDDLPWHPGPEMNVWGRVHTNGNIWFAPEPTGGVYLKNLTSGSVTGRAFRHCLRHDLSELGAGRDPRGDTRRARLRAGLSPHLDDGQQEPSITREQPDRRLRGNKRRYHPGQRRRPEDPFHGPQRLLLRHDGRPQVPVDFV